jgi:calumenin
MQADKDHDGRLTLEEMVENPYAFYGSSVYLSDDDEVVVCVNND